MGNKQSNFWENQQFISNLKNNAIYGSVSLMKKGQNVNAVMQFSTLDDEEFSKLEKYLKLRKNDNFNSLIAIKDVILDQSIPFLCGGATQIEIILEYSNFTLQTEIKNKRLYGSKFRGDILDNYAKDMVKALKFMEDNNIHHGMLTPQNIIYQKGLKILDLSRMNNKNNYFIQVCKGDEKSLQYLSPQYAGAVRVNPHIVTDLSKSDVWSLGIIFLEMVHTDFLEQIYSEFEDETIKLNENQIKKKIQEGECSFFLKKLIRIMLQPNEKQRPNFTELIEFISSYNPGAEIISPPKEYRSSVVEELQFIQPTVENSPMQLQFLDMQSQNSKKLKDQFEEIKYKYFQSLQPHQNNTTTSNSSNRRSQNSLEQIQLQYNPLFNEKQIITHKYSDGSFYEGEMKNNIKEGHGTLIYKSGGYQIGNWRNDEMNGDGSLYYPNGQVAYKGSWLNGHFHGWGVLFNEIPIRESLDIEYRDLDSIGDQWVKYQGQFEMDCKHGRGCLYFTTGEKLEGLFANDKMHGEGSFFKQNGLIIRGRWYENKIIDLQKIQ